MLPNRQPRRLAPMPGYPIPPAAKAVRRATVS
nr:MAG TPA: hypothetical protein [Caudoviricetes sp.]